MTQEQLQLAIDQFDEQNLEQQAIFGIFMYGGGGDESFIRANKQGLELYALQLLRSAQQMDDLTAAGNHTHGLNSDELWIDESSDVFLNYIEFAKEKHQLPSRENYQPTLQDKLIPAGCLLILVVLLFSAIVGLVTLSQWLF